ncbi:glycine/D-amino acid oxidase-like deaminating enzyme/nitrite reductase/ring-hydroxylating ferredoxin subunit [Amycolatopsis bartoniae]|nr:FAD-dependent oxidoreductase [Amycolatopsis bartoniae]MBB2937590.1 glycine/D-amino acid oxidase-like deaminating enzyme/nitrite reductase/ring-hydroxylating ferredoxin subunit [Amycolatopsis bartoniae]TVS99978.1 FAD-dependent oxidoreductase [Amycolatopsis bartoniae]
MQLPDPLSLWVDTAPAPERAARPLPTEVDVVVIGAGIAGLTTAYALANAGRSVLVAEAGQVAGGVSGHTTAKVTAQHALKYASLKSRKGLAGAQQYARSQLDAIDWIERTAAELNLDCDFERRDSFVYSTKDKQVGKLKEEADAAQEAGLPASFVSDVELPITVAGAVRVANQAQFHPRKWLLGLAAAIEGLGGTIIEQARVQRVDERPVPTVHVRGDQVRAQDVVIATHYPILDRGLYFARLEPTRDLVVTGEGDAPDGMYLDADTHHSVRGYDGLLIVGGEHYRTGEHVDVEERYQRLSEVAATFGVKKVTHRWSAHDMSTLDGVPYVGRYHLGTRHLWVATGFGQWGMTGGTAAGLLLDKEIRGEGSPYAGLYDPNRFDLRSGLKLAENNGQVTKHLVGDHVRATVGSGELPSVGEGKVVRRGTQFVATYRADDGNVRSVNARCTHLGCLVAFNNAEKTWDCPCHGSRFGTDGSVIQGPATRDLPPVAD